MSTALRRWLATVVGTVGFTAALVFAQVLVGRAGWRADFSPEQRFVLSDHADWPGLLEAIAATGAERVWVTHGYVAVLVRYLRERGLDAAGLQTRFAEQDVCCHAVQDKVFVTAPDVPLGWWEYYTVTDDNPAETDRASTLACGPGCTGDATEVACCS